MKRHFFVIAIMMTVALAAYATGGRETPTAVAPTGPRTVRVHLIDSFRMILDGSRPVDTGGNVVAGLDSNINVEWVITAFGGYEVRAKQILASRNPDVDVLFYLSSHLSPTVMEQMVDLGEFQRRSPIENFDDIFQGARDQFTHNGELKGIPFRNTIYLMFYNRRIYQERLGTTQPPRTIEEFWNNVRRTSYVRSDGTRVHGLATYGGSDGRMLTILAKAYGAQIVDRDFNVRVNDPEMIRFVTELKDAYNAQGVPPNLETLTEGDLNNLICEGIGTHVVMPANFFSAVYNVAERCGEAGNIGFAPFPAWSGTGRTMANHYGAVWSMTIPRNLPPERQMAAWEFIRHISAPDQHNATLLNQNHPVRMSAYDFQAYRDAQPVWELLKQVSEEQVPLIAFYDGATEAMTIFGEEVTAAIKGLKTVTEALGNAQRRIESSLASYGLR